MNYLIYYLLFLKLIARFSSPLIYFKSLRDIYALCVCIIIFTNIFYKVSFVITITPLLRIVSVNDKLFTLYFRKI